MLSILRIELALTSFYPIIAFEAVKDQRVLLPILRYNTLTIITRDGVGSHTL